MGNFPASTVGFGSPPTGQQGDLLTPQIKSPNFNLAQQTGWAILRDGNAYFFNVTVSGSFIGEDFVINDDGEFFYSGTPAFGNLALSLTSSAGTDDYGNSYLGGVTNYDAVSGGYLATQVFDGNLSILFAATAGGTYQSQFILESGLTSVPAINSSITITGDALTLTAPGTNATDHVASLLLNSNLSTGTPIAFLTGALHLNIPTISPVASALGPRLYGVSGAHVNVIADDGNTYDVERLTQFTTVPQPFNVAGGVVFPGLSVPLGVGTYRVHMVVPATTAAAAGNATINFLGPAVSLCALTAIWTVGTSVVGRDSTTLGGALTSPGLAAGGILCVIDGIITTTATGNLVPQGTGSVADPWTADAGVILEVMPVTA
jgi:hypothetical protein